jgi:hypothetical protein
MREGKLTVFRNVPKALSRGLGLFGVRNLAISGT